MSIPQKKKICKGKNKAKSFPGCGELRYPQYAGLCKTCLYEWMYSTGEGEEFRKNNLIPKAKKEIAKSKKIRDKKTREALKTLSQLEGEAKKPFQKYIRFRDQDKPCISCGTFTTTIWDGGHFYKAEIYSGLIFNEQNCHKQCRKCNSFLGGNENNYRLGLIERYGIEYVENLDRLAIEQRDYKYSRQELIDLKKHYQQLLTKSII